MTAGMPSDAQLLGLARQLVEREVVLAGHRGDLARGRSRRGRRTAGRRSPAARGASRARGRAAPRAAQAPEAREGGGQGGGVCGHENASAPSGVFLAAEPLIRGPNTSLNLMILWAAQSYGSTRRVGRLNRRLIAHIHATILSHLFPRKSVAESTLDFRGLRAQLVQEQVYFFPHSPC